MTHPHRSSPFTALLIAVSILAVVLWAVRCGVVLR